MTQTVFTSAGWVKDFYHTPQEDDHKFPPAHPAPTFLPQGCGPQLLKANHHREGVAATSLQAYQQVLPKITPRQNEVLQIIKKYGPSTADRIHRLSGYEEKNMIAPRVTELKQAGIIQAIGIAKTRHERAAELFGLTMNLHRQRRMQGDDITCRQGQTHLPRWVGFLNPPEGVVKKIENTVYSNTTVKR